MDVGYLSQHAEELGREGTVLEAAQRATGLTPNKARALLGRFLFSGEEAEKPLEGLSGGERRRLSLAVLVHSGANFLIIDEPTNHLDLESREALEDALRAFDGTLLLVSHDRALLDAVGTRTIAIEDRKLESYLGGWADYLRVREERKALAAPPKAAQGEKKAEAEARRHLEGPQAPDRRARARDRGGRGVAARARGRAGRPVGVGVPHLDRALDQAPRGGEAEGRGALRAARRARGGLMERAFATAADWEAWLEDEHERTDGIWLKIAKKASGIESVTHAEALEVALCFGWIDGQRKAFDENWFLQRFTPRRRGSKWSQINREKVEALIAADRVRPAGLREYEEAKADGRLDNAYEPQSRISVPPDLQKELDANPAAARFFETLDSQNRYAVLYRIQDAKRPETRARRIAQYVEMLAEGRKLHP